MRSRWFVYVWFKQTIRMRRQKKLYIWLIREKRGTKEKSKAKFIELFDGNRVLLVCAMPFSAGTFHSNDQLVAIIFHEFFYVFELQILSFSHAIAHCLHSFGVYLNEQLVFSNEYSAYLQFSLSLLHIILSFPNLSCTLPK